MRLRRDIALMTQMQVTMYAQCIVAVVEPRWVYNPWVERCGGCSGWSPRSRIDEIIGSEAFKYLHGHMAASTHGEPQAGQANEIGKALNKDEAFISHARLFKSSMASHF